MIYPIILGVLTLAIVAALLVKQTIIVQLLLISLVSGSLFAIAASGLSLTYGIQKVMNVAHGDLIILGSYLLLSFTSLSSKIPEINPVLFVILTILILGISGVFLNVVLIEPVKKYGFEPPILITFGALIFIEAVLQLIYGGDVRGITIAYSSIIYVVISKTDLGRAIRASSQDAEAAEFLGINVKKIQLIAFVIATMLAGEAGVLYGLTQDFTPTTGPTILITILAIIVLGGIGSLSGTFVSSMVISIIDVVISYYVNAGIGYLATLIIFLIVIVVKPTGIFGRSLR